jgi:hypothetical protein
MPIPVFVWAWINSQIDGRPIRTSMPIKMADRKMGFRFRDAMFKFVGFERSVSQAAPPLSL